MQQMKFELPIPEGYVVKFVAFITLKNGKRIYAKAYGKRAFPLIVKAQQLCSATIPFFSVAKIGSLFHKQTFTLLGYWIHFYF